MCRCGAVWLPLFHSTCFRLWSFSSYRSVWTGACPGMRPTRNHWTSAAMMRDSTCLWRWVHVMINSLTNFVSLTVQKNNNTLCGLCSQLRGNYPCVLLAEQGRGKNFVVYKPNIGKQTHPESLEKLHQKYRKVRASQSISSVFVLVLCYIWVFWFFSPLNLALKCIFFHFWKWGTLGKHKVGHFLD